MNSFGWQRALLWPALPAAAVIVVWAWYGRNRPQEHPSVTPPELAELDASIQDSGAPGSRSPLSVILTNRSILLLSLSYVCMNYVFYLISNWCFLYLVQERHFTVLEGGVLGILPPLAAAVGAGVGGKLVALACERWGTRIGFRVVPMTALPAAGLLLLWAVQMSNAYLALIVLSLAYCVVEFTEGAFWGGIMFIGRKDSMVAGGVLNTGGNLGGLIGIPIVGYLSSGGHWTLAFVVGAGFALISALLWLGIDTDKSAYETA